MGRKSSVKQLPPAILKEVNGLLSEGRATLDEILSHLQKLGAPGVSRSALGRYRQDFEEVAARLRQSREITESFVRDLGPNVKEGEQGRLLVEMVRTLVQDHLTARVRSGEPADSKSFQPLSRALKDLAQANRLDQDFEHNVRKRVEKETLAKLDDAAKQVTGEAMSPQAALEHIMRIYRGEA